MRHTILLIHGFPLDHTLWDPNIAVLSAEAEVMAPDVRGFGGNKSAEMSLTMEAAADDLLRQLDSRGVQSVVPCGLSMGGYIAMAMLERAPARIAGLILCNTRSAADTQEAKLGRETTAQDAMSKGMAVIARAMVPKVLGKTTLSEQPALAARIEAMMAGQDPAGVAAASRGMALRPDRTELLRRFTKPALVITGDEDGLMPLPTSSMMVDALPKGELVIIEGAGHLSNVERPEQFNETVSRFLQNLPH